MDPTQAFRNELERAGLHPHEVVPDGVLRRCGTTSHPRDKSGWYTHYSNPPAGVFGDWRTGGSYTWTWDGRPLDMETRKRLDEQVKEQKRIRREELARRHAKAANDSLEIIKSLPAAGVLTPYLLRKKVRPCPGLKADGQTLVVPVIDPQGRTMSLQRIEGDGSKRFLTDGKVKGGYFPIQGGDGPLYVVEGIATGLSVHRATGMAVLCAFNAGNLEQVARMARVRYPERDILIAGDDDRKTEARAGKNPGRVAASAAARAVGGKVTFPVFTVGKGTDFNDLYQTEGIEAVRKCLEGSTDPGSEMVTECWPEPVPFDESSVPGIDPDLAPEPLKSFCEAVASSVQVPFELVFMGALGAVAVAVQGMFRVQVREGYFEPLCMYSLTPLPPGERKSAGLEACKKPLVEWEREQARLMAPEIKRARSELQTRQKAVEKLRAKAGVGREDLETIVRQVQQLEEDLPMVPVAPRLFCDDATPEALAEFMSAHHERAGIMEAEGGIFEILSGLYTNGRSNLNLVLKCWSGEATTVDRKGKDAIRLMSPVLTFCLTPQPEVLRDIAGKPGFRGRGLLGRFLYCLPTSLLGGRSIETQPVSAGIEAAYRAMLLRIVETPSAMDEHGERTAYVIRLSEGAYRRWVKFAGAVESHLRDGGEFETMRDWAGKLSGQAVRIAGLYHVAREGNPTTVPISEDTMKKALDVAAVLAEHAKAAFGFMSSDPAVECARRILKWIIDEQVGSFSSRDAFLVVRGTFPKMEQILPGLRELQGRVYIRPVEGNPRTGPGRPASPIFEVNPYAHNAHNSQN